MAKPNSQFSLKRTVARLPAACFPKNEQQTDKQTDREKDRQTDRQTDKKISNSKFQETILLLLMLVRLRMNIEGPGQKQFPGEKLRY